MVKELRGSVDWQYFSEICICCGARGRKAASKVDLNRSNFINVQPGAREEFSTSKRECVVVQTKNGPLTVSVRHEW